MSSSLQASYTQWDKYDVDAELGMLERREQVERAIRAESEDSQKKTSLVNNAADSAQFAAESLEMHAAVAALRARKNAQRAEVSQQQKHLEEQAAKQDGEVESSAASSTSLARTLSERAAAVAKLADLMARLRSSHDEAEAMRKHGTLQNKVAEIAELYNDVIDCANEVEAVLHNLPVLPSRENLPNDHREAHAGQDHQNCNKCSSSPHSSICDKDKQAPKTDSQVLPKEGDLLGLVRFLRKDAIYWKGVYQRENGDLADAADSFRTVLLEDAKFSRAWIERAKTFAALGNYLLAELHYAQVRDAAADREAAEEMASQERNSAELFHELDIGVVSIKALLVLANRSRKAGDVLLRENAFASAMKEYDQSLAAFRQLEATLPSAAPSISGALNQCFWRQTKRRNLIARATCAMHLQKDLKQALQQLTEAETLSKSNVDLAEVEFRRGQICLLMDQFESAACAFRIALDSVKSIENWQTVIGKELERAIFLKEQYKDMAAGI